MTSQVHCLQPGPEKPAETLKTVPRRAEDEGGGRVLACIRCQRPITTAKARIEVAGSHAHTFANPNGYTYRIGCFARAAGLVPVGERSTFWSWFPLHSWQIEECGACREHLGWLFRSSDHQFHGLILDRLVELEEGR